MVPLNLTVVAGLVNFSSPISGSSSGAVAPEELDKVSVESDTGFRRLTPEAKELPYKELWHRLGLYYYSGVQPMPAEVSRLAELGAMTPSGELTSAGQALVGVVMDSLYWRDSM